MFRKIRKEKMKQTVLRKLGISRKRSSPERKRRSPMRKIEAQQQAKIQQTK